MDDNKVAVLVEDLMSQFRTFGEGQQILIDRMDRLETTVAGMKNDLSDLRIENQMEHKENQREHQELKQMILELASDQKEIKEKVNDLDQEFEIKLRRVK
jgi:hypothetical protein